MKKITVLFLLSLMVFSLSVFAEDSLSGEALKELGLIQGDGNGLNESGDITREALVKMVVSLSMDLTDDFVVPESPTFSDVPKDHWAYSWVERAYAGNLTKGIGNGLFGLGQKVTKQQVAAFMLNTLNATYDYKDAVEFASNKGISTQVLENFNRGNAFEMVSKTLLLTPAGQEKALFETNKNFQGKNFKQIVADLELRRDEAKKAAEAIAAAEAKKAEEERLAQAERNLERYRSTWPNNLDTYFEWLANIEEMLEPTWKEISYKQYNETQNTNIVVHSKASIGDYLSLFVNRGNTMTIEYYVENLGDGKEEILVPDVTIFYSEKHDAFKVEADYEGEKLRLFYMKDSNSKMNKGHFKYGKDEYFIRLTTNHPVVGQIHENHKTIFEESFSETFNPVNLSTVKPWLAQDITLQMEICTYGQGSNRNTSYSVGLDTYTFMLSQITSNKLSVKKVTDDEIEVWDIHTTTKNEKGDAITMYMGNKKGEVLALLIILDENQAFESAYVQYKNNFGTYIED